MDHTHLMTIVTIIYAISNTLYFLLWIFKMPSILGKVATLVTSLGFTVHTVGFVLRWIQTHQSLYGGHAPLTNKYESLIFFSWMLIAVYLIVEFKCKHRIIGVFTIPIALFSLAYASLLPNTYKEIKPLIPALKSDWLVAHVMTCFVGYAAFSIAFGFSVMYLLKRMDSSGKRSLLKYLPDLTILDELNYRLVMFGFLFLTIGIITGSVWANSAWGRWWGFDPKETWSLITWIVYGVFLHVRYMRGWRGIPSMCLSIIGFMAVIVTYLLVNYLPGLHSYGLF